MFLSAATLARLMFLPGNRTLSSAWVPESSIKAAHIFPYGAGQTAMDELFGRPNKGKTELLEPVNEVMMSVDAEKRVAIGMLVLKSNLLDNASAIELDAWSAAKVSQRL